MAENKISFWKGTNAQYVNETHSDSVIYFVLDEFSIYVGNVEVSNNKIFFIEALAARYQDIIDRFSWGDDGGIVPPPTNYDKDKTYLVLQVNDGDTVDFSRYMDEITFVDWGDGVASQDKSHMYETGGVYDVVISHADSTTFSFNNELSIKEVKSVGYLSWYRFAGAFMGCENLDKVHPNAFDNLTDISVMDSIFSRATSLRTIPARLFDKCVGLESIGYGFADSGLTSIPMGIFDMCKSLSNVSFCFSGCANLNQEYNCTSIGMPALWERDGSEHGIAVTSYTNFATGANPTFRATVPMPWGGTMVAEMLTTKIAVRTSYPNDRVDMNYKIDGVISVDWGDDTTDSSLVHTYQNEGDYTITISHADTNRMDFARWSYITEVIQVGKTMTNDMQYMFQSCSNLSKIHANAFDTLTSVKGFRGCFSQCSKLKDVPAKIFDNCTKAATFDSCFQNCNGLTTIPDGLFDKCLEAKEFRYCFQSCREIKSPYNCTSIDTPKLWERDGVSGSGFAEYSSDVFRADIPKSWGGSLTVKVDVKFSIVKDGAWLSSGDVRVNDIPCTIDENLVYTTSEKITGPYTITLDGETIHSGLIMDDFDVVLDTLIVGDTSSIMGGMDFSTMSEEDLTSHILYNDGWTLQTIDGVGRGLVSNQVEEYRSTRINFNTTMKGVKVNFNQSSLNPSSDYLRIGFDGNIEYNAWDIEGDKIVDVNRFNMLEYRRGPNSTNEGKRSNVLIHSISYPVLPPKP